MSPKAEESAVKPQRGTLVQYQGKTYKVLDYIGETKVAIRPHPAGGVEEWVAATDLVSGGGEV
ncbi:hypothetical protein GCM10009839_17140 [Catenulispora yoronensis]|uniref:Uncharacterized protein n=1 Tax=Catenulispora yoronensis TaxID=450799 RepID=A0ABP5F8N4_9ACTN